MSKSNKQLNTIELILVNSRKALQNNLDSFDVLNKRLGLFITISMISIPLFLNIIIQINFVDRAWLVLFFIPILINIVAFYFFIKSIMPNVLDVGLSHNKYQEQIKKDYEDVLLFEIGCNKDSILKNDEIVRRLAKGTKLGINLQFISVLSFVILFCIYLITN